MRIKTAPRHRILQRDMKVMSAAGSSPDEETIIDVEKDYDSRYAIDRNSYQMYESSSALISVMMSTTSKNELSLLSTNTSPLITNDDNNNMEMKYSTVYRKKQIFTRKQEAKEEEDTKVVNLSTKDAFNRVDEVADTSARSGDKLKDTFLYKIMTDPNFLENIQRSKQPKKFICLFCKEDFTTSEELTSHMDVKRNDSNQIVCCACKKTFAEKRYLKYHRRCHSERTKFTCDICTRKYTRLDNLTRHNVLHVNPDKFCCTICNRTFTRKDLLNKHRKSHDKYNLYCEKCGKYFRRVLTLENHQKTHGKISGVSVNATSTFACKTENLVKDIDRGTNNLVCTESTVRKTENFTLAERLVCKTEDTTRKTQNNLYSGKDFH